jgi:hypothetical protein
MTEHSLGKRPVFDPEEWAVLRRAVEAISEGDAKRFARELGVLSGTTRYADRSVIYIGFALRYLSIKRLSRSPTQQDLQRLAADSSPRYEMFVPPDAVTLIELLESVWDFRDSQPSTRSNALVVFGCVGVAVLLDDTGHELDEVETAVRTLVEDDEENLAAVLRTKEAER